MVCKKLVVIVLLNLVCIMNAVGYSNDVGIIHYDANLKLEPENNTVHTRVCCKIQNDSPAELKQVSFDILARQDRCKARTDVHKICQKVSDNLEPLKFQRDVNGYIKLIDVTLDSGLAPGATTDIVFEYTWQATEPMNVRDNYRPFATVPSGQKELCLLSDYAWLPVVKTKEEFDKISGAGRFSKEVKPSWTVRVSAPSDFEVVALGGRHVQTTQQNGNIVSEWKSNVPFYPQLMAGRFQKQIIPSESIKVVLYLPNDYGSKVAQKIGEELAQAYDFFTEMFGPLKGDDIHIGVSSAGQGGHGGYLSFTMDTNMLGQQITEERIPMIMEIMRHELAHSWWGWSVTSYGTGTKFLRESLANFSNAYFVEKVTGQDRLAADMAKLFWMGLQKDVICGAESDSERAAYLKGHLVLNVLREEMGDDQFFKTLKQFASNYQGGHVTMSDFINTCKLVTGKDWTKFFNEWCFNSGVPDYQVENLESEQFGSIWDTKVVIKNVGSATITCPLELRMEDENDRKNFRVEPGEVKTMKFITMSKVKEVIVDPDHRTYQGSGRECRLKMLGVGDIDMEWIWYWRGVVLAEEGQYDRAITEISRARESHGHPAFSYSRGIAYLKKGDLKAAHSDLIDFLDMITGTNNPLRSLVYPGILSQDKSKQQEQLNQILHALTGKSLTTHQQWCNWWKASRKGFRLTQTAQNLDPGGLRNAAEG
jgi:hypothetical protein